MSQRTTILQMLEDAGSEGVTGNQFYAACLPRFAARIKELRDRGYEISTERLDNNHFVYKLSAVAQTVGAGETDRVNKCGPSSVPSNDLLTDKPSSPGGEKGSAALVPLQESERVSGGINTSLAPSLSFGGGSEVGIIHDELARSSVAAIKGSQYDVEAELDWENAA